MSNYIEENGQELIAPGNGFDLTVLSNASKRQLARTVDEEMTESIISAVRANTHSKAAVVAMLSQAQLEESLTELMRRNPRLGASVNLMRLAEANTNYLVRLIEDDRGRRR